MNPGLRPYLRWALLLLALPYLLAGGLLLAIGMACVATANLLAREPEKVYHLRLRPGNPDDQKPPSDEEIASLSPEDRALFTRWLRAYRKGLGQ